MGSVADVSLITGIVIATVIVIAYTVLGGLMADALTDFVQAIAVILGLIVLAIVVSGEVGGFSAGLANVETQRLAYFGADNRAILERLEEWAIPIFGTMVSVELIARVLGTNSARTARNACILGGVLYLCVGLIPVYLGLIGPSVMPGLAESEQIIPSLAEQFLPTFLFVIFAGALISAILSTVDSALLSGGSIVSHNLLVPMRPDLSEAARVRFARGSVIVLGLIAFAIALRSTTIHDLVETASAIGSAGLIVVALFGLFTRFGGSAAAASALVMGAVVWLAAITLDLTNVPYVFAVAMAALAYVGVGLFVRGTA